jgi:hypothetical protein
MECDIERTDIMGSVKKISLEEIDNNPGYYAVVFGSNILFNGSTIPMVRQMFDRCQGKNKRLYWLKSVDNLPDLYYILDKNIEV